MTRGRKPKPTALKRLEGNPASAATTMPSRSPPEDLPDCPRPSLAIARARNGHRIAGPLHEMGVLTMVDRAALAAYCQAWGRWVEAEEKLKTTPTMLKTPSGYVQQNPWLSVANKQLELMGRYMAELGITPASRSRVHGRVCRPPGPPADDHPGDRAGAGDCRRHTTGTGEA